MHLGIDFWKDFGGFLDAKWTHVGTKIEQKSMPTSNNDFLKKTSFTIGKTMMLSVQGIEVGGKKRWKIDQKMKSRWEGILASIFLRFWWILGPKLGSKMEPRSIQNGVEKNNRKKKGTRMHRKSQYDTPTLRETTGPGSRAGGRGKERGCWEDGRP